MFEEAEFEQAVKELKYPNLDGWEFFVETSLEGVHCKIYRQYDEVCNSIPGKGKSMVVLSSVGCRKLKWFNIWIKSMK